MGRQPLTYLLLWLTCAVGPADHVIPLPDYPTCLAVERALQGDRSIEQPVQTECRNPEWASIVAAADTCGWAY